MNIISDTHIASLERNGYCVIKNYFSKSPIIKLRDYLTSILAGQIPNYHPISIGAPNFFRLNLDDVRSTVRTHSVQYNFFPWNQDLFNLFKQYEPLFKLREVLLTLSGAQETETGSPEVVKRISIQYYPSGAGYMESHQDPYTNYQTYVCNVVMSEYGKDYHSGGLFVHGLESESPVYVEREEPVGSIVVFRSDLMHGVSTIDPDADYDPLSGCGRWMLMSAVTRQTGNRAA